MGIFPISDPAQIQKLFANWPETFIWSFLQGCMGRAWADDPSTPRSAKLKVGDFCMFAGEPNEALILHQPAGEENRFVIYVPQNEAWSQMIERACGPRVKRIVRFATQKDSSLFHRETLERLAASAEPDYHLQKIDEALFHLVQKNAWSQDLCSQFKDFADYSRHGIGIVALHNGEPVSGASSYTYYQGGIEIEIDTREDFRRRGLATACGARLILECLDRGLYPSWDAHDRASLSLAEKLGYRLDRPYPAYEWSPEESFLRRTD